MQGRHGMVFRQALRHFQRADRIHICPDQRDAFPDKGRMGKMKFPLHIDFGSGQKIRPLGPNQNVFVIKLDFRLYTHGVPFVSMFTPNPITTNKQKKGAHRRS
jgi:hypothetical protein